MWKQIHQDLIYKQEDLGLLLFLLEKDALIPREFITEVILNIISPAILKTPIKKKNVNIIDVWSISSCKERSIPLQET